MQNPHGMVTFLHQCWLVFDCRSCPSGPNRVLEFKHFDESDMVRRDLGSLLTLPSSCRQSRHRDGQEDDGHCSQGDRNMAGILHSILQTCKSSCLSLPEVSQPILDKALEMDRTSCKAFRGPTCERCHHPDRHINQWCPLLKQVEKPSSRV